MQPTATDVLDALTVPVPCPEPWEGMTGDDRVRRCARCRLDVHDLSAMPREEAVAFLRSRPPGARTCVQFRRRPDGRVVTDDCGRVVRAIRRRAAFVAGAVAAGLGLGGFAWARASAGGRSLDDPGLWDAQPFRALAKVLPASWLPVRPVVTIRGDVALPPPPVPGSPR